MKCIHVIVETPKGSAQKYAFDKDTHLFKLKKILPPGMVFPYDFGFIPDTKGGDGDPLDVIVISEFYSFPGILMECRIIGCLQGEQSAAKGSHKMLRNDRFIAIPKCSNIFHKINSVEDLPADFITQLEDFFVNYNKLAGKKYKPLEKLDARAAMNRIKA